MTKQFGLPVAIACVISAGLKIQSAENSRGEFPVHAMVRSGSFSKAIAAIPTLTDLNDRNSDGHTLLTLALQGYKHKNFAFVEALLRHGADKSTPDAYGLRPIHYAARNGGLAVVRLLVKEYSANVNAKPAKDSDAERRSPETTPLAMAYHMATSPDIIKFLERHNARAPKWLKEEYEFFAEVHENVRKIGKMEDSPEYSGDPLAPLATALKMALPESSSEHVDAF